MPSRSNHVLTMVADDGRRSWSQMLFGNCTFNIESIPICDGGTLICVTKVALDHVEVTVHQDDSSGVSKQRENLWHRAIAVTCQSYLMMLGESWLFKDGKLNAFWMQFL